MYEPELIAERFTHPAHVHVFLLDDDAGVRLRYAESGALKRRLLSISYPPSSSNWARRKGPALPGIAIRK
jgi:hypothetical protein